MPRILVADDASFMRMMIREIVEAEGYEVVGEASDGVEAAEQYTALRPDVVTMDIVMPRLSGIDAVRRIIETDPDACVVMCSALGQESLVTEALGAGARDFIVKPFKPESVVQALAQALAQGEKPEDDLAVASQPGAGEAPGSDPDLDPDLAAAGAEAAAPAGEEDEPETREREGF